MTVNVKNRVTAFLFLLATGMMAGPAGATQECPKGLEPISEFRLFFGLADSTGKTVTEDE